MADDPVDSSTPLTLISREGDKFVVTYELISVSSVLKRLFARKDATDFEEQCTRVVQLREISTATLRKIIEYCEYKHTHERSNKAPPKFEINGDEAMELLMGANFLDV
jgi:transcription elongation factor B subunit 1